MDKIKILLTFNDLYAPHAAVVMESVIRNAGSKVSFIIMYFDDELSESVRTILRKHFESRLDKLEFCPVDVSYKKKFDGIQYSKALTVNTFLRLLAPDLLPQESRLIYLDCDLLVQDDVYRLVEEADFSYSVNAVPEHYPSDRLVELRAKKAVTESEAISLRQETLQYAKKKYLGMDAGTSYFNAGVMAMNLNLWRQDGLLDKIIVFLKEHPLVHSGDQDALNGVLNGRYGMLPLWWNVHSYVLNLNEYTSNFDSDELKHAKEFPSVIHFAGYKAWQYRYEDEAVKKLYWQYRGYTPWPEKREQGKTLEAIFIKRMKNPLIKRIKSVVGYNNIQKVKKFLGRE
jgi:hypothetical protein